ncbi:MAG: ferrochelatase [Acinetobacter junii]|jgi:ferrochelatase|uniref:Ferrochelatase n=3 Tax=Acinetobacter junii TaxID=40215 RepID=A0A2R4USI5_ACIJU|nr:MULTISPECIES: ferrochelatase [Acinetobacter]MBY3626731.1 ferrochelatase [Acinetobacter sp. CUI P1]AVZ86584.1 ferrochelatase [Acinetobacter sp. WCHA45]AWA49013.1 ferrochelatase [Acinetobacter junii]EEY92174.1 ferrochelatase [Acinetobacter junii SH205]ENV48978.1 ferrochelatase [Acinetobacter junii CIP 107470 = MTCC 11364]
MSATPKPKVTVILANLGTPDEATAPAVRRFLKQFLSDTRVIEIPKFIWWVILHAFVLPFRPKRVAQAYASVWSTDSPMREIVLKQTQLIKQRLLDENHQFDLTVVPAMTYGQPSIYAVFEQLEKVPQEHVILLPLFPQYSATSTAPLYDAFARWIPNQRHLPGITMIKDYYQHPLFIQALVDSVLAYQEQHGKPEKLLMSFHGIPQPYADKGDPYADRCRMTAKLVAEALHLNEDEWAISFQSRFGKQEWVKPYTDVLLEQWGQAGVRSVQVLSPAFSADCLETLEELAVENKETFQHAGGGEYAYIPALNTDQAHIDLLASLVQANLDALTHTLAHR